MCQQINFEILAKSAVTTFTKQAFVYAVSQDMLFQKFVSDSYVEVCQWLVCRSVSVTRLYKCVSDSSV